jgi:hypothetical protein
MHRGCIVYPARFRHFQAVRHALHSSVNMRGTNNVTPKIDLRLSTDVLSYLVDLNSVQVQHLLIE